MHTSFKFIVAVFLGFVGFVSCSKSNADNVVPQIGTLKGNVQVWDDKLNSLLDRSGVTITIQGTTPLLASTNVDGQYTFENLPFGEYDLLVSKPDYGTFILYGVKHIASTSSTTTIVPSFSFGQKSTTSVTALTVKSAIYGGVSGVSFNYTLSPVPTAANKGYLRYFLSTSPTVSNTSYEAYSSLRSVSNNNAETGFTADDLASMGFKSGQTVYAKLYGDSFISNQYFDANIGKTIFPNVNTTSAPAVSFKVP